LAQQAVKPPIATEFPAGKWSAILSNIMKLFVQSMYEANSIPLF